MIEKTIEVERMEHVISVFGSFDQNLRIIETELGVKVLDRDDQIHICGEAEAVMLAEKAINGLLTLAAKGRASTHKMCATSSSWCPRARRPRSRSLQET